MAKDVHYDARRYALHEQQGRAGVAQVVETSLRQPRFVQHVMERLCHSRAIQRSADWSRKDETTFPPTQACGLTLSLLTVTMFLEGFRNHRRHCEGSTAPLGF